MTSPHHPQLNNPLTISRRVRRGVLSPSPLLAGCPGFSLTKLCEIKGGLGITEMRRHDAAEGGDISHDRGGFFHAETVFQASGVFYL